MIQKIIDRLESLRIVRAVRNGLISLIPVLIIGAFALVLDTFPVDAYQEFITTFLQGALHSLFVFINKATFGVLSVYASFFISRAYMKLYADEEVVSSGAIVAAMICFFVLVGAYLDGFNLERMGPKGMFIAILTGLSAPAIYVRFDHLFRKRRSYLFSAGADQEINRVLRSIIPITLTTLAFAIVNVLVTLVFNVDSFHELFILAFNALFSIGEVGFFKGFFFVFLSSFLWFFGIHGSDVLEEVMQTYFVPGLAANQAAVAANTVPQAILTKEFFDCFVLMGGCGTTISLLIALLIFSKSRAQRGLGLTATVPMIFNINELMVFGLPIVLNPIMLIPFLAVPLACYSISYLALSLGLVPLITSEVTWTTPIILGGFTATGSFAGSILQVFNVLVGVAIYVPFLRKFEKDAMESRLKRYDEFMDYYKANESSLQNVRLTELGNVYADFAKALTADLKHDLQKNIRIYYQPQYNYEGKCVGAEALLRWVHPQFGILFPPLVIKLAADCGELERLEEAIIGKAISERGMVLDKFGADIKLSINVTGTIVTTPRFLEFCKEMNGQYDFNNKNICLEVTEQSVLDLDDNSLNSLRTLRGLGLTLAIDDFSMGQTSIQYLQYNLFDIIKLDGSLIKGLLSATSNCREIISTITELSTTLHMTVLAEFVEKEEQKEILHEIGCDCYQGYLYSPAISLT
ncbi:MAG: PTS sugar transporter subunit IIC/EAL domain-containing protein [Clostridia bacterium]|nr:PTS sugar transporter subunit IIC/EAL domain-containing protein [Clostridia bacterium]